MHNTLPLELNTRQSRSSLRRDLLVLAAIAFARLLLHLVINRQYGFHRDELAVIDDARHLAWGYVAYPPVTPFFGRLALILFGPSLVGVRLFATLAQCVAMVLAGLIARELGGKRNAQVLAALATAIAPVSLAGASLFQYVSFDYLWWILIAYMVVRMLNSGEPRWWLGVGATIGIGMLTKYTIGFYVAGLVVGVLATTNRRYLFSPWLWLGVLLSILIFSPNLLWQYQHEFISLDFLRSIHQRDVAIGRTNSYLIDQIITCINVFTLVLALTGLYFYALSAKGQKYRVLAFMFVVPLLLFLIAKGRGYYMTPAYPMLLAAGAVYWEDRIFSSAPLRWATWTAIFVGGVTAAVVAMPVLPINSSLWRFSSKINEDLKEEIGWPELVNTVARVYYSLPPNERVRTGILTGNYGEAGAVNLYGPSHGLPGAISVVNSYWLRGYGDPPPETVIVLGVSRKTLEKYFGSCEAVATVTNDYGITNEETEHRDVFICRNLREPWPDFWKRVRSFG